MDKRLDQDALTPHALLIAFHFPPVKVSSGVQRTLAFSRYLADYGWQATVLSAHPRAFPATSNDQLHDVPASVDVVRAPAWDTSRHLSFRGRYVSWMALPDRWISWWVGGVFQALRLVRKKQAKVVWSTYPIATAHLIGWGVQKLTGLPWVADFRDSMVDAVYPAPGSLQRRCHQWIERRVVRDCQVAVFTTPSAVAMYQQRYPNQPADKFICLPNGYNEAIFAEVLAQVSTEKTSKACLTLVHSGVLYPSERDPLPFFNAIAQLKNSGVIASGQVEIVLRATGHDALYQPALERLDIADIVHLAPAIDYREALTEMLDADGLLIFQAANCNHQIPAKLYEYFRAQRPVFALTDSAGDTAATLQAAGLNDIASLDDQQAIAIKLQIWLDAIAKGQAATADPEVAMRYSRQSLTATLARVFTRVAGN